MSAIGERVPAWLVALVWTAGAAVVAGRAAVARVLLVRLRRRRAPADAVLRRRVRSVAERVGLRRRVRLVESRALAAPLAFGVVRPTVVLPRAFAHDFDAPAQEAVLAHELAHLAARDPLWLLAADAATVLLWWHPLVWMARRRLSAASEAAADEASLLVDDGPQRLADCLLRWGRRLRGRRALAYLGVGGTYRSGLGRRLVRLVALRSERPRTGGRWPRRLVRTAGPILLVILAMLMTGWVRPGPREKGEETMGILRSAWTKSIAGTVVLAVLAVGPDAAVADEHGEEEGGEVRHVEREREGEGERRREGDREREHPEARHEGEGERDHPEARRDREGEREGDREREGRRGPDWEKTVDRALQRWADLRRLKRLAAEHGSRGQVKLVEQLLKEQERRYERLLRRKRGRGDDDEGEERERHRDRDDDDEEGEEREWHRDRDDDDDEGEEREWHRERDDDDDEGEEREWHRERDDDDEGEGRERHRDRDDDDDEGEERERHRERDDDDEGEERERHRDREGEEG